MIFFRFALLWRTPPFSLFFLSSSSTNGSFSLACYRLPSQQYLFNLEFFLSRSPRGSFLVTTSNNHNFMIRAWDAKFMRMNNLFFFFDFRAKKALSYLPWWSFKENGNCDDDHNIDGTIEHHNKRKKREKYSPCVHIWWIAEKMWHEY